MNQLTLGAILKIAVELRKQGMSDKDIATMLVYIGDDDELNGIHTGWDARYIHEVNDDSQYFIDMINDNRCNVKFKGKAVLIS